MAAPDLSRIPAFYHRYIQQVKQTDLNAALKSHLESFKSLLTSLPSHQWDYRYADGKWSIKELVQHVIDAERIFCYRALCFARRDKTSLPGFDEDSYALHSRASSRSGDELIREMQAVQQATVLLFASFDEEQLEQNGTANNNPVYVGGIGYIIVGHTLHHMQVMRERYL